MTRKNITLVAVTFGLVLAYVFIDRFVMRGTVDINTRAGVTTSINGIPCGACRNVRLRSGEYTVDYSGPQIRSGKTEFKLGLRESKRLEIKYEPIDEAALVRSLSAAAGFSSNFSIGKHRFFGNNDWLVVNYFHPKGDSEGAVGVYKYLNDSWKLVSEGTGIDIASDDPTAPQDLIEYFGAY